MSKVVDRTIEAPFTQAPSTLKTVNVGKNIRLFIICVILSGITNLFASFSHTSINTAVNAVDEYLKDSYAQRGIELDDRKMSFIRGIYNSIYYAGILVGAVAGPRFPDMYGRKAAYIFTCLIMTTSCAIQSYATLTIYPEIMIVGRLLGSLVAPMNDAVMIVYAQETSPPELKSAVGSLYVTGYAFMALVGMIVGMENVLGRHLTLMLGLPIPIGIFGCLILLYLKETPKFLLITRKNKEAAKKSLLFYQGLRKDHQEALENFEKESQEQVEKPSISDFLSVPYLRLTLILGQACLLMGLPFFTFLMTSTYFMEKVGIPSELAQISSTFQAAVLVASLLLAMYLLKLFNRRTLLMVFGILSIFSLLLFSICGQYVSMKYLAMAGIFGYMMCFGLAIGPISNLVIAELVPLQYRSSIICIVFSLNGIFVVGSNVVVAPLFEAIGSLTFLPLFVVPLILSLVFLWFYLPETRGFETHEIVQMLKNGNVYKKNSIEA